MDETTCDAKKACDLVLPTTFLRTIRIPLKTEEYYFSEDAVERALINKIKNKQSIGKTGRKVDELKMQLYKKLL